MHQPDRIFLLALARATFLRPIDRVKLAGALGGAAALAGLRRSDFEELVGRPLRRRDFPAAELLDLAAGDALRLTRNGIGCIFLGEPGYPRSLAEIHDPPVALFHRGSLPDTAGRAVAIVGTRRATWAASAAAREAGRALAGAGLTVVSGLARGIDGEAHRGAVAVGGRHVAVLGCGLERILPASNAELGRRILRAGGALLSEQPPDEPPRKHHFPARNRIISGLSQAVVVVQAPEGSGALITADFALEHGAEVLVHSAGLGGPRGAGGEALVESGARTVGSGAELLRLLGIDDGSAPAVAESEDVGTQTARALERELEELD